MRWRAVDRARRTWKNSMRPTSKAAHAQFVTTFNQLQFINYPALLFYNHVQLLHEPVRLCKPALSEFSSSSDSLPRLCSLQDFARFHRRVDSMFAEFDREHGFGSPHSPFGLLGQ